MKKSSHLFPFARYGQVHAVTMHLPKPVRIIDVVSLRQCRAWGIDMSVTVESALVEAALRQTVVQNGKPTKISGMINSGWRVR